MPYNAITSLEAQHEIVARYCICSARLVMGTTGDGQIIELVVTSLTVIGFEMGQLGFVFIWGTYSFQGVFWPRPSPMGAQVLGPWAHVSHEPHGSHGAPGPRKIVLLFS